MQYNAGITSSVWGSKNGILLTISIYKYSGKWATILDCLLYKPYSLATVFIAEYSQPIIAYALKNIYVC